VDFYDPLKSRTQGYASLDYSFSHYAPSKLVKLDILVNGMPVDALSLITPAEKARNRAERSSSGCAPHPAPDVRRAVAGGRRRTHHRPRDDPRDAQEVLASATR